MKEIFLTGGPSDGKWLAIPDELFNSREIKYAYPIDHKKAFDPAFDKLTVEIGHSYYRPYPNNETVWKHTKG